MVHCCQKENTHAKCESNTKAATHNVQRLSPLLTLTDGPLRAQALCEVVCLEAKGIEIEVGVSTWISMCNSHMGHGVEFHERRLLTAEVVVPAGQIRKENVEIYIHESNTVFLVTWFHCLWNAHQK